MRKSLFFGITLSVLLWGCPRTPNNSNNPSVSVEAEARELFSSRCSPCHGATGAGDGVAGASLNPRPRNFHDPAWQRSITDNYLERIILEGGAGVGKSPLMPANGDLAGRPELVRALRSLVRSFQ